MNRPQLNNNPFALMDKTPSPWKGLLSISNDGFMKFENPVYGIRAGFINLVNAYLKRGIDTIEKIFPVYAPVGHGNNIPEDYIKNVVRITGIPRDKKITSQDEIYKIGKAIITHEEGKFWVNQNDFDSGFKAAMIAVNSDSLFKATTVSIIPIVIILILLLL
jgi:hypothetical protein